MRVERRAAMALLLFGAASCATGRKDLGEIKVTAEPPLTPNQIIDEFTFRITEGRIAMESPGNPTAFDLTEESDGCLRGTVKRFRDLHEICRLPTASGDPPGLSRWRSVSSVLVFTVQLNGDESRIVIDAGPSHGEFLLGQGAAADELRKRPELLGAAFASGYVPRAGGTDDGSMLDYTYTVSSRN
jgi:hypothetical protein